MKRKFPAILIMAAISLSLVACGSSGQDSAGGTGTATEDVASPENADTEFITPGTEKQREFVNDNVLHSAENGEIHFSRYIPESYDGTRPYALFITLPGWEGLYYQGVGANMAENFGTEAISWNPEMIILSPQLNDWSETSADQTIALTEYFLRHYNIDQSRVYLEGYSGGGETGSLVMGKKPELYTAFLAGSTQWDGDLQVLADARVPVYMIVGEDDSYYGSKPLKEAYESLRSIYQKDGLTEAEIQRLVTLDVRDQQYFTDRGFTDQHAGGQSFAEDKTAMGWLFGQAGSDSSD